MLWYHDLLSVTDSTDPNNPVALPFLQNYEILALGQVLTHASTYALAQGRLAQESAQLYYVIMNSLSATGRAKISVWSADFSLPNGQTDGLLLLKVIIRESDTDTKATVLYIRQQLASLDEYIGTVDSDIKRFNTHVKSLIRDLQRRLQQSTNVLTNLFRGYKAASDKVFVKYIMRKEEEYEEGSPMNADALMNLAENKYKICLRCDKWNSNS